MTSLAEELNGCELPKMISMSPVPSPETDFSRRTPSPPVVIEKKTQLSVSFI